MSDRHDLPAEFRDLIDDFCSDVIDDEGLRRLEDYLRADEAARRRFVAYFHLHTELQFALRARRASASVLRMIEAEAPARPVAGLRRRWALASAAAVLLLALSAALLVSWTWHRQATRRDHLHGRGPASASVPAPAPAGVEAAPARPAYPRVDVEAGLAIVVRLDGVRWEDGDEPHPAEGDLLAPGRLRFRSGRATLTMLNGVVLIAEGPADIDLISTERVFCRRGKLRTRVTGEATGFVIASPSSSILELGTEFGLNVDPDGKLRVTVFQGRAEAVVQTGAGEVKQERNQFIGAEKVFEIDPEAGQIKAVPGGSEGFIAPLDLPTPSLVLDPAYPEAVLASRPRSYWRFDAMPGGAVANAVAGGPALRAVGPVGLGDAADGNRAAVFRAGQRLQYLAMDGLWQPDSRAGYAVELWFVSEAIDHASLVSLPAKDTNRHLFFLELTSRNRHALHPPASIRFLDRWPPGQGGGYNIYSRAPYIPYRWHHLVGQMNGGRMELFLDGEPTYSLPAHLDHPTAPTQVLLGRLSTVSRNDWLFNRGFVGRLDEVALYDHPLSIGEVRRHHRLGSQRVRGAGRAGPRSPGS